MKMLISQDNYKVIPQGLWYDHIIVMSSPQVVLPRVIPLQEIGMYQTSSVSQLNPR